MTQTIILTLSGDFSHKEVYAVRTDKDLSRLRCVLRGYRYESGDTAILRAQKPDGAKCYLAGESDGENAFGFTLTDQMTAAEGDVFCDICIYRGDGNLSSDAFLIKVRPPAAEGDEIPSENDYTGFVELIKNTVNAREITESEINLIWEEEEA